MTDLTPGFDPSTLSVGKLRSILLEHNVDFLATAKKKHLIELFDQNVSATKTKIRPLKKTKKSKKGKKESRPGSPISTPDNKRPAKREAKEVKLPGKGNLFEVDSDSDSDILSPRKKPKTNRHATPLRDTTQDSINKSDVNTSASQHDLPVGPADDKTNDAKLIKEDNLNNEDNLTTQDNFTPVKNSVLIPFSPIGSSDSSTATHEHSLSEPQDSPKDDKQGDSSEEKDAPKTTTDLFVDSPHSFDKSWMAIRHRRQGGKDLPREERDVELAKLLGVDLGGVKPKKNGRRVVTPRRPIIIQEKRLSKDYYTLADKEIFLGDDNEEKDSHVKTSAEASKNIYSEKESLGEDGKADISLSADEFENDYTPGKNAFEARRIKTNSFWSTSLRTIAFLTAWISLIGVTLFAYWYREQTFLVGYCGQEIIRPTIPATSETPELLVAFGQYIDEELRPQCVKCPQHARCFPNLEIACYDDFVEYTPWYFSYMPIVDPTLKKCIPNTKKAEKIEIMIDVALDLLRARNANRHCGNTAAGDFEAGVSVQELHDLLLSIKAPYITEEEFEELWARSVVELEGKPEIIVRQVNI